MYESPFARRYAARVVPRARRLGRRTLAVLGALTATAAALRFATLGLQSYWYNEAASVLLAKRPFGDMLDRIPRMEGNPPLYYVLAWLWAKAFGPGEVGLRSLSALCGTAMVPAAYAVGARLGRGRAGLWLAALTALSPLLWWFSQEARPYILLGLLTALSLLAFLRFLGEGRGRDLAWWSALSALALGTHYFALAAIAPQAAVLVWRARSPRAGAGARALRPALLALVVPLAVAVALVPLARDQSSPATTSIPGPLATRSVELPKQLLLAFDAPLELELTVVAALLVLLGAWLAFARTDPDARGGARLAGGLGAAALAGVIAAALVGVDYLNTRNMIETWLPLAAVVAIGVAAPRAGRWGPLAGTALAALGLAAILSVDLHRPFQRDDWRGAARALGPARAPRAIVVTPGDGILPLAVYLPRAHQLAPGVRVAEIDVLGVALRRKQGEGPRQPTRVPPAPYPQFRLIGVRRDRMFLVARYRAPAALPISEGNLVNTRASRLPALYLYEPPESRRKMRDH